MKTPTVTHRSLCHITPLIGAVSLLFALSAPAADRTWENTGTDVNTSGNWVENAVPGSGDRAVFNNAAVMNPELTGSLTIQGLVFNESGYTLSSDVSNPTLTLTHSGTHDGARPIYQNTAGTNTISANLEFGATGTGNDQVNVVTGGGSLILTGNLTGINRVVDFRINNSASSITLAGSNNFAAGFKQSGTAGSTINASHVNGVNGSGNFSIGHNNNPGTILNNTSGSTISVDYSDFRINSGHTTLGGGNWEFLSANMTLTGTRTLNTDTDLVVIGGNVGEDGATGNLIKGRNGSGTGTLELRGESTYTGFTEAQSGVLLLKHADALAAGNLRLASDQIATSTGAVLGLESSEGR